MTNAYSGQRALILGGSCELAIALAKEMVAKGLLPMLAHRNSSGKACIDASLEENSGKYKCVPLDLAMPETLSLLDNLLDEGVDYLVDFAQGDLEGVVASVGRDKLAPYFETHIANRTSVIQGVCRSMIARRRGRMVYVSSAAAGKPNPGQGFYAAVKLACEALYRNVGIEMASRGVTTVTLRPGYVDVGRGRRYLENNAEQALSKVPLGRALDKKEVVDAIMFLLSDGAVGFNATVITMDGGLSSCK